MGRPQKEIKRMNARGNNKRKNRLPCVYRYIDTDDRIVKYVGIVHKADLSSRLTAHLYNDDWCRSGNWDIEYFECQNRSEAEAFESHLIAVYETWKYYNKAKANWGINRFLPNVENWWKPARISSFADNETAKAAAFFRQLIREGRIDVAKSIIDIFDFDDFGRG
jgi:hypothetical protein